MVEGAPTRARMSRVVARVEAFYLSALRIMLLLLATLLVLSAVWLGLSGLYRVSRNAAAVKVETATVTPAEIADIPIATDNAGGSDGKPSDPLRSERLYYKQFVDRYYALFAEKYQAYRQPDDNVIDRAAFDRQFVKTDDRLSSLARGELDFASDKSDLEALLANMQQVAGLPATADRLQGYKYAKKTKTTRTIRGSRAERYCSYYGDYIGECIIWATRQVPYERTVTDLQLPNGLIAPVELLHAYQDRHFDLLATRRRDNADKAEAERNDIVAGNMTGAQSLWQGLLLVGGFLAVMFLFLLIAIERHQRRLAALAPTATVGPEDSFPPDLI